MSSDTVAILMNIVLLFKFMIISTYIFSTYKILRTTCTRNRGVIEYNRLVNAKVSNSLNSALDTHIMYVIRGKPGTGLYHLSDELREKVMGQYNLKWDDIPVIDNNKFFLEEQPDNDEAVYKFNVNRLAESYYYMVNEISHLIMKRSPVIIVRNHFPQSWMYNPLIKVAIIGGYTVKLLETPDEVITTDICDKESINSGYSFTKKYMDNVSSTWTNDSRFNVYPLEISTEVEESETDIEDS